MEVVPSTNLADFHFATSLLAQLDPDVLVNVTITVNTTSSAMEMSNALLMADLTGAINRELSVAGVAVRVGRVALVRVTSPDLSVGESRIIFSDSSRVLT